MRVIVNALSARRGGIITYTRNLMQSFREKGVDAVFALPTGSTLHEEDVETIRFPVTSMSPLSRAVWERSRGGGSSKNSDLIFSIPPPTSD